MGRVLKSVGRIVPAEVLAAREQAAALVGAAKARAIGIEEEASAAAATLREEARRQGFEAGRAAAEARVTGEVARMVSAAERARGEAPAPALKLAADLATKMVERIVGKAVELAPSVLAEIVEQALQASRARAGVVKLRVHPEDLALLEREPARQRLIARVGAGAELRLLSDPAVGRYGCVVETAAGRLDARLETQIAALEKALLGESESSHG